MFNNTKQSIPTAFKLKMEVDKAIYELTSEPVVSMSKYIQLKDDQSRYLQGCQNHIKNAMKES